MKKNQLSRLLLLSLLFFLACKKKDVPYPNVLKGIISGAPFESTTGFSATPRPASGPDSYMQLKGSWSSNKIVLTIYEGTGVVAGDYVFGANKQYTATLNMGTVTYTSGWTISGGMQGSGKISITAIDDKHVEGTFEFVTSIDVISGTSKTVTGGSFNLER